MAAAAGAAAAQPSQRRGARKARAQTISGSAAPTRLRSVSQETPPTAPLSQTHSEQRPAPVRGSTRKVCRQRGEHAHGPSAGCCERRARRGKLRRGSRCNAAERRSRRLRRWRRAALPEGTGAAIGSRSELARGRTPRAERRSSSASAPRRTATAVGGWAAEVRGREEVRSEGGGALLRHRPPAQRSGAERSICFSNNNGAQLALACISALMAACLKRKRQHSLRVVARRVKLPANSPARPGQMLQR